LCIAESKGIHAAIAFEQRDAERTDGIPDSDRGNLIDRNKICGFQRLFRKEPRQVTGHLPELGNLRFWRRLLAILVPGLGPGSIGNPLTHGERWRKTPFRWEEPGKSAGGVSAGANPDDEDFRSRLIVARYKSKPTDNPKNDPRAEGTANDPPN